MAPWFANPNDNPNPDDPSQEANKSPSFWDRRQNKTLDTTNTQSDGNTTPKPKPATTKQNKKK